MITGNDSSITGILWLQTQRMSIYSASSLRLTWTCDCNTKNECLLSIKAQIDLNYGPNGDHAGEEWKVKWRSPRWRMQTKGSVGREKSMCKGTGPWEKETWMALEVHKVHKKIRFCFWKILYDVAFLEVEG